MVRKVLVIAAAFGIVMGGLLLSASTEAAPGAGSVVAARQSTVPQQTPKKHKKHKKHHKKTVTANPTQAVQA